MIPFDRSWAEIARAWLANLAPVVLTALVGGLIAILAFGGWAVATQGLRIHYLGIIALALVGLVGVCTFTLYGLKLDGFKLKAGKDGMEAEIDVTP